MDDQKKKSFAEILANTGAAKHNSDLQNLAHAKLAIKGHMKDLAKLDAEIDAVVKAIEDDEEFDYETVKKLYDRAHNYEFHAKRR